MQNRNGNFSFSVVANETIADDAQTSSKISPKLNASATAESGAGVYESIALSYGI